MICRLMDRIDMVPGDTGKEHCLTPGNCVVRGRADKESGNQEKELSVTVAPN
jgi:hypothetical protein